MAGTSYTRQSTIADGNIITAALFNNEFNQLLNAFAYASSGTTGHTHDGSAGQGAAISKIGDQDFNNKVVISATDNRIEFYCEVSGSPVEQVRIQDGAIVPVTDSDVDLGTTSVRFKDFYVDSITCGGTTQSNTFTAISTGSSFNGCRFSNDVTFVGVAGDVVFDQTDNALEFADDLKAVFGDSNDLQIYHDGSNSFIKEAGAGILYLTADTQISMGSSFGNASLVVEASNGTTFSAGGNQKMFIDSGGVNILDNVKLNIGGGDDLQIYHDGSNSYIEEAGTGNLRIRTGAEVFIGTLSTTIANFDAASSVDLYYNGTKKFETTSAGSTVSGSLTATGAVNTTALLATTNVDTPQIEVTSLRARDGTVAGSIADSTGVTTLNSAVLTTADINGGTIDGATIGGSTPAVGTFTTANATTVDATTVNATTVDATNVEVTNIKAKDGTSAGSIADSTGVVTLASSVLTTTDINGGTADNVVIGGSTAAAGSFTTLGATGLFSGTDISLSDSNPTITLSDSDGTNQKADLVQAGGSLVTTVRNNTSHGSIDFKSNNGTNNLLRLRIATSGDTNFYETDGSTVGARWDASAGNFGFGGQLTPQKEVDVTGDIRVTGGIYFGTTATADYLDDYEEGTYTPVYKGATTDPTYDSDSHTAGRYTKIGRVVHVVGRIRTDAGSSPSQGSGQLAISLPFAVSDDTGTVDKQFGVLVVGETKSFLNNNFPYAGWASRGTSRVYLTKRNEAEQQTLTLNTTDALDLTDDNKNDLVFSITYFTDV